MKRTAKILLLAAAIAAVLTIFVVIIDERTWPISVKNWFLFFTVQFLFISIAFFWCLGVVSFIQFAANQNPEKKYFLKPSINKIILVVAAVVSSLFTILIIHNENIYDGGGKSNDLWAGTIIGFIIISTICFILLSMVLLFFMFLIMLVKDFFQFAVNKISKKIS